MRKYNLRMGVKIGIIYVKYMPKKNERFFSAQIKRIKYAENQ